MAFFDRYASAPSDECASLTTSTPLSFGERWALLFIAVGLIAPWWLPIRGMSMSSFYKEWLTVVAFGFAGMSLVPSAERLPRGLLQHPLILLACGLIAVLVIQAVAFDGVWRKAAFSAFGMVFLCYCIVLGYELRRRGRGFDVIAFCVLAAALGSCAFALLQLAGVAQHSLFVLPRDGTRLAANVGQANHFVDLLWLGSIATAYLAAQRRIGVAAGGIAIVILQAASALGGSRSAWLYLALVVAVGLALLRPSTMAGSKRLGGWLLATALGYGVLAIGLSAAGVWDHAGLIPAEQRLASADGRESNQQRLWFWSSGIDAAMQHPMLGLGAGNLAGYARERAVAALDPPPRAADAHAHNVFIQLAAEEGIPIALLALLGVGVWLTKRTRSQHTISESAALVMVGVVLIHANLEHPLAYLYFLALLGLLVGVVEPTEAPILSPSAGAAVPALRIAGFALVACAAVGYLHFQSLERSMRIVLAQVNAGKAPQATSGLDAQLAAVPAWSPYRDWAETLTLMVAVPTSTNANALADRCERAVSYGPTPYLLARCATALQVAGRSERATNFATSLCKVYPDSDYVLAQSIELVEATAPAAGDLKSPCVQRVR